MGVSDVNGVGQMMQELRDVFATGKTRGVQWRLDQLNGMVRLMDERSLEIAEAMAKDLRKPAPEAMREIKGMRRSAILVIENIVEWMEPETVTTTTPFMENAAVIPEPLGIVLVFSTWNFPFALSVDPVIAAVSAGNCVVLKPSELAPATSALVAKLVPLYLDPSAVRVFEGGVPEATALLEQRWDKILFTGSTRVGKIVMAAAAKHLTPVILELGGKSPTIVDSTADLDVNKMKDTIKQFYGDDLSSTSALCHIINKAAFQRLTSYLNNEATIDKVIYGGQHNEETLYIAPTLILDPPLDSPIMQDEIFGPLLIIITVKDVAEAITLVNSRPKPLSLYVFTDEQKVVEQVLRDTSSGGVIVNDTVLHVGHFGLPFGGVGDSGMGTYHGKYSFDSFSHKKPVLYGKLTGDIPFRYPSHSSSS